MMKQRKGLMTPRMYKKDPQKRYRLGMVSKKITGGLDYV